MSELSLQNNNKFWTRSKLRALGFWHTRKGERINFLSHLFGAFLSLIGAILLVYNAIPRFETKIVWGFAVYGASLFLMYTSSTVYHASTEPQFRKKLQVLDHCSIYLLIAGTYTPFTLTILKDSKGPMILGIIWGIAIFGIIFKIIMKDKYDFLSTMGYLVAGWVIVLDFQNFYQFVSKEAFGWILAGGVLYSIGAIFYLIEKMPRNHEIWHFFVLSASISQFIAIYFYI